MCNYQQLHRVTPLYAINALVLLLSNELLKNTVGLTDISFTPLSQFSAHFLRICPFLNSHPLRRSLLHVSAETNKARGIFYIFAHATEHTQTTNCPLPHTRDHKGAQLASVNLIEMDN